MNAVSIEKMIEQYFSNTTTAITALFEKKLYGHVLIIIYSAIDTCGLLDAPSTQVSASGESFKSWVKKYLLSHQKIGFNEVDLWAARCGVLHSFTAESDLSRSSKARELVYYTGDPATPETQKIVTEIKTMGHLPVHYGDLVEAFFQAIAQFIPALGTNCESDFDCVRRLRKVLQIYRLNPAP